MRKILFLFFIPLISSAQVRDIAEPPSWAKSAIWYELFVERFHNGDPSNDPTVNNINVPGQSIQPDGWKITPWTSDWYTQEDWAAKTRKALPETFYFRRYGGDLEGVLQKLDYLKDLGVNALYFRPVNDAPSLHKYDARSYHHVDIHFGPDPEGDKKIIASEDPRDPSTWKWTAADKLFLNVVDEAHKRGMKVVMDYSWNHTGILFWAFQNILNEGERAQTKDWYMIKSFDDPSTPVNEFAYDGWVGIQSLPEIKKVDVTTTRVIGHPYEGDIHPDVKKHIYDVTKRWLTPDGNTLAGVDGFRLDVADHVGLKFWREFRTIVRTLEPEAYLVGEIWWEKWPEQLMNPRPYTNGDVFDAVMFYQVYRPARYFFAKTDYPIDAKQFRDSLEHQWSRLKESVVYAMMNTSSSADAPRLLTDFFNTGKYKVHAKSTENPGYKTGKPDDEAYQRLRLYLIHLFTTKGGPAIYYGEEAGMWGADDPEDRKPMWWKGMTFDPETRTNYQPGKKEYDPVGFNETHFDFYKKLIAIRKNNPVLASGKFNFDVTSGKALSYTRTDDREEILVLFNAGNGEEKFVIDPAKKYTDLLTGKKVSGREVKLSALTAMILKKKK
ncbi:MAG TPA: alpha-amylase family glycosyl hydrolase [Ohtaekwangia sp.]